MGMCPETDLEFHAAKLFGLSLVLILIDLSAAKVNHKTHTILTQLSS